MFLLEAKRRAEGEVNHVHSVVELVVRVGVDAPLEGIEHQPSAAERVVAKDFQGEKLCPRSHARADFELIVIEAGMVRTVIRLALGGHAHTPDDPRNVRAVAVAGTVERVAVRLRFIVLSIVVFPGEIPAIDLGRGERARLYLTGVVGFIGAARAGSAKHRVGVVDAGIDHRNPYALAVKTGLPRTPGGFRADSRDTFLGEQPIRPWPLDPLHAGELGQAENGRRGDTHAQGIGHAGEALGHADAAVVKPLGQAILLVGQALGVLSHRLAKRCPIGTALLLFEIKRNQGRFIQLEKYRHVALDCCIRRGREEAKREQEG